MQKKERFLSKEKYNGETLNEMKEIVNKVQNEDLCSLLLKHKLLKKPLLKIERDTSEQVEVNDYDPQRHTTKEYFLKMAELYNQFMFTKRVKEPHGVSDDDEYRHTPDNNTTTINKCESPSRNMTF